MRSGHSAVGLLTKTNYCHLKRREYLLQLTQVYTFIRPGIRQVKYDAIIRPKSVFFRSRTLLGRARHSTRGFNVHAVRVAVYYRYFLRVRKEFTCGVIITGRPYQFCLANITRSALIIGEDADHQRVPSVSGQSWPAKGCRRGTSRRRSVSGRSSPGQRCWRRTNRRKRSTRRGRAISGGTPARGHNSYKRSTDQCLLSQRHHPTIAPTNTNVNRARKPLPLQRGPLRQSPCTTCGTSRHPKHHDPRASPRRPLDDLPTPTSTHFWPPATPTSLPTSVALRNGCGRRQLTFLVKIRLLRSGGHR